MGELHDLAPFWVLGVLEESERLAFEAHLDGCAQCLAEVAELGAGVEVLARSVAEPAPADMKADVMARLDEEAPADDLAPRPDGAEVVPIAPRRRVSPLAALVSVAAALAIVLGIGLGQGDPIDEVIGAPDAVTVRIDQDLATTAEVIYSPETGNGVFTASGLGGVPADRTYQLWLIGDEGPTPAGLFVPGDDGAVRVLLEGAVRPGLVVGLTVEPAGGSPAPTGDVLLTQEI